MTDKRSNQTPIKLELLSRSPAQPKQATPLLFVHGAWHAAWCWAEHFLGYFADRGYAAYALSLRAHGGSDGRQRIRSVRVSDFVCDVARIVDGLPSTPVLIGHSLGGLVIQKYLESHSVPAGVLMSSVPPAGALGAALRQLVRHPLPFLKVNLQLSLKPLIGTPALARDNLFSKGLSDKQLMRYFAMLQDESYLGFLDMMIFSLPKPARVKTPLLVMGGGSDRIFTQNEFRSTARAYHTQAVIFPNQPHDLMLETGWQEVADHILNWLKQQGIPE